MFTINQLETLIQRIKLYSNYDLSDYARNSLMRRFNRITINFKLSYEELLIKIKNDPQFIHILVEEITVNTTELFRDPNTWTFLRTNTMLNLAKRRSINIWIAGCSTGQEAYSMAILLNELGLLQKSRIFATDINNKVLKIAKEGVYKYRYNLNYIGNYKKVICKNPLDYDDKSISNTDKYFIIDKKLDQIKMQKIIKDKIIFMHHDLVNSSELDFAKFDLISCRNVLIYLNQDLQTKILNTFHNSLREKSFLLLGIHESILGQSSVHYKKKGTIYLNI